MRTQLLLPMLLLAVAPGAFAQSATEPAAPATTQAATTSEVSPAQKARLEKQNAQMTSAALQIAQMVDRNQIGLVWDNASSVAKQANTRADFVQQVSADRVQLGALKSRRLTAITRTHCTGGELPPGLYISMSYTTQFANAKQPVSELISYHLDADGVWRVAGYTVR